MIFQLLCIVCSAGACAVTFAADPAATANVTISGYDTTLKPFLGKYCVRCHGAEEQNADLRLDNLGPEISSEDQAETWQEVLDVLNTADMPPPGQRKPTSSQLQPVLSVLYRATRSANDLFASQWRGTMRRMNRREYVNTIIDKLGVTPDVSLLPEDIGEHGFDTHGESLIVTLAQLEAYLEAGRDVVHKMVKMNIPGSPTSGQVRRVFGDLSSYGGKPSKGKKKPKGKKKLTKTEMDLGTLPSPPDKLASPIFKRFLAQIKGNVDDSSAMLNSMNRLFVDGRKQGMTFWEAIVDPMITAISSPSFIYVVNKRDKLSAMELASRLSYFLWSSAPDPELLRHAKAGTLLSRNVFSKQIMRMAKDPKADRFYTAFTDQWLELDRVDGVAVNANLFRDVKANEHSLKTDMKQEVRDFIKAVIQENLPVSNLVDSDFTMLNDNLAAHYGMPKVGSKTKLKRVQLSGEHLNRGGLLGKGAILMLTSNGTRTSLVERGVYVLRKLLDSPPPPAPANVPVVEEAPSAGKSTRALLRAHSETPQCAVCHRRIDPLGFGLESFGPMGKWRTSEKQLREGADANYLTASHQKKLLPLVADGNSATVWSSKIPMKSGMWLAVDLGSQNKVSEVILDNTTRIKKFSQQFSRNVSLEVSSNGKSWRKVNSKATVGQITKITCSVTTRYLKIVNGTTMKEKVQAWRIGELQVNNSDGESIDYNAKAIRIETNGTLASGTTYEGFDDYKEWLAAQDSRVAQGYVKAIMSYALGRHVGFRDASEVARIVEQGKGSDYKMLSMLYFVCTSNSFRNK